VVEAGNAPHRVRWERKLSRRGKCSRGKCLAEYVEGVNLYHLVRDNGTRETCLRCSGALLAGSQTDINASTTPTSLRRNA